LLNRSVGEDELICKLKFTNNTDIQTLTIMLSREYECHIGH